jgi:nitrite reductase/ring-hydroxylating ferredoxin subunit/uncharacterized membrane protein
MSESKSLQLIDQQEWIEPAADQVQKAVTRAYESGGEAGQAIKNFLHGTWLGHPLHSALTDVPIGAWTAAVVMDAMSDVTGRDEFGRGADAAVAIGLAGAVAAAAAGITDWQATDGRARKTGFVHGMLNMAGAALFTASLAARKNGSRSAGRGLSTLGYLVAMGSAYLGGKLVYSEQIGVDHTVGQQYPNEFVSVLPDADLAEGQMRRVEVNGNRLLLARRDARIFAISEVCSHLGGPLADGEMKDCTVRCPWHGSRFSLETGQVIDGPATHPQPCLDVRVVNGHIEVRHDDRHRN